MGRLQVNVMGTRRALSQSWHLTVETVSVALSHNALVKLRYSGARAQLSDLRGLPETCGFST